MTISKKYNINQTSRPVLKVKGSGKLVITREFLSQMQYLCETISTVEWSGLVFYKAKGKLSDPDNFRITPYYIHVMDKGTGGSTEFDDDGSMKELYQAMPELDPFNNSEYRYGKIHSH